MVVESVRDPRDRAIHPAGELDQREACVTQAFVGLVDPAEHAMGGAAAPLPYQAVEPRRVVFLGQVATVAAKEGALLPPGEVVVEPRLA